MFEEQEVCGPVGKLDVWLAGSGIECLCSPTLGEAELRVCTEIISEAGLVRRIHARNSRTQTTGCDETPLSSLAFHYLRLFREAGLAAGFSQVENLEDVVAETVIDVFGLLQLGQPLESQKRELVLKFLVEVHQRT